MTPLRQRYLEDMQLRGYAETTQEVYANAVGRLAKFYGKSPEKVSHEELRAYFLYLIKDKQVSGSSYKVAIEQCRTESLGGPPLLL